MPVVYLHAAPSLRGDHAMRIPIDNAAVAQTAFRELSANRPAAFAAFCGWRSDIALRWLFRRRTGMSMREWRRKNT